MAAAPAFALARFLRIHAHDNPIGALRGRWPAAWYVDGRPWNWLLICQKRRCRRRWRMHALKRSAWGG